MSTTTISRLVNREPQEKPGRGKGFIKMQVKTSGMQQAGIHLGDVLLVEPDAVPENGSWLVLDFEGRLVIRMLQAMQGHLKLLPLHGHTQPIDWPVYAPLPLVGVVRQVIRKV